MQRLDTTGWSARDRLELADIQTRHPRVQVEFQRLVESGESVPMAAMLAVRRQPSAGVDDRMVMAGSKSVTEQFENCPDMLNLYRKNYRLSTGENLPEDAVVYRSLAKFPGDPACIVTHKHGLADVKAAMKLRNCEIEGDWENHPVSQAPEPQTIRMNNNVLGSWRQYYLEESDERERMATLSREELDEMIVETHAPIVTPDDAMNAATTIDECHKRTFDKIRT